MPGKPRTGKPVGRPRGSVTKAKVQLSEMAQEYVEVALKTLVEVCRRGDTDGARVQAANALLDRGFGKPIKTNEISGPNGGAIQTESVQNDADAFTRAIAGLASESEEEEGS